MRVASAAATAAAGLALAACAHGALRLDELPPVFNGGAVDRYGSDSLAVEPGGDVVTFTLAQDAEVAVVAVAAGGEVRPLYPMAPGESSRYAAGRHTIAIPVSFEWVPDPSAAGRATAAEESAAMAAYRRCLAQWRPRRVGGQPAPRAPGDTSTTRVTGSQPEGGFYSSDAEVCRAPTTVSPGAPGRGAWRPRNDIIVLVASPTPISAERLRQRVLGLRVRSAVDLQDVPGWIAGDHLRPPAGYYSVRFPRPRQPEM